MRTRSACAGRRPSRCDWRRKSAAIDRNLAVGLLQPFPAQASAARSGAPRDILLSGVGVQTWRECHWSASGTDTPPESDSLVIRCASHLARGNCHWSYTVNQAVICCRSEGSMPTDSGVFAVHSAGTRGGQGCSHGLPQLRSRDGLASAIC
jgi:hypothetical protein